MMYETLTVRPEQTPTVEWNELWDKLDTPILRVIDDEGVNVAEAQVRRIAGRHWLYVDDTDGYLVLDENNGDLAHLTLVRDEDHTPLGYAADGSVIEL